VFGYQESAGTGQGNKKEKVTLPLKRKVRTNAARQQMGIAKLTFPCKIDSTKIIHGAR